MSFVEEEDVMGVTEGLLCKIFKAVKNLDIKRPFRKMSFNEAMDKYGSDKPDLRFGMELKTLDAIFANSEFAAFKNAANDPKMVETLYQYGRYLMISGSRGGQAMNLQGIRNKYSAPAWGSLPSPTSTPRRRFRTRCRP